MHGQGSFRWKEKGSMYEGEYVEGFMEGRGKMTIPGEGVYEGQFLRGQRHGVGTWTSSSGTYQGEYARGRREGLGTLSTGDGCVYEGTWRRGMFHGEGVWRWADGRRFEGVFKSACPCSPLSPPPRQPPAAARAARLQPRAWPRRAHAGRSGQPPPPFPPSLLLPLPVSLLNTRPLPPSRGAQRTGRWRGCTTKAMGASRAPCGPPAPAPDVAARALSGGRRRALSGGRRRALSGGRRRAGQVGPGSVAVRADGGGGGGGRGRGRGRADVRPRHAAGGPGA
jgi:hypothetical protein